MRVRDVMTWTAASCYADMNLAEAVEIMWNRNCGFLPIVDAQEKVLGVITDRDICIALGTRNRLPGEISVKDVATKGLYCCNLDDDVRSALQTMTRARVRRLPAISDAGKLEGVLSMDDVVFHTELGNSTGELLAKDVVDALKKIYSSPLPQRVAGKAAAV